MSYFSDQIPKELISVLGLIDAFASEPQDEHVLLTLTEHIPACIEVARCSVVAFDPVAPTAVVLASHDDPSARNLPIDLDLYPELQELQATRRSQWIADVRTDPRLAPIRDRLAMTSFTSLILHPVESQRDPHCLFAVRLARSEGAFEESDFLLSLMLAKTTGALMDTLSQVSASRTLQPVEHGPQAGEPEMIGTCEEMRRVFATIRKYATSDYPVLIEGESGTGKELAALAIHERSAWSKGPFVPINCAAIPETLLESELFGHEKGAFTGAHIARRGKIEAARGGTLFLDEIGELSLPLQAKLLRFLETHEIETLGSPKRVNVDLRVIAASNAGLERLVNEDRFRRDLYHRLSVLHLTLPLLREREEDILIMAKAFLKRYARETGADIDGFTTEAQTAILTYSWPGNVRELINRIRRAVVMSESQLISREDLELPVDHPAVLPLKEAKEGVERDLVGKVLRQHGWKYVTAAKALGISRTRLHELAKKYGLKRTLEVGPLHPPSFPGERPA